MDMDLPPPGRPLLTKLDLVGIKVNRQTNSGFVLTGLDCTRSILVFLKVEHSRRVFFCKKNPLQSKDTFHKSGLVGKTGRIEKKILFFFSSTYHCRAYHLEIK